MPLAGVEADEANWFSVKPSCAKPNAPPVADATFMKLENSEVSVRRLLSAVMPTLTRRCPVSGWDTRFGSVWFGSKALSALLIAV